MFETKIAVCAIDTKDVSEDGVISGYGAVFGNVDQGGDILDVKSMDETLEAHKTSGTMPKMLWQHDPAKIVGKWTSMEVDEHGLKMQGKLITELPLGKEAHVLTKHGVLDGLSIGYRTKDYEMEKGGVRRLKSIELLETSLVTFPMNTSARITDVKQITDVRQVERILRDAGIANKFAKLLASHGFEQAVSIVETGQRDADREKDEKRAAELADLKTQLTALKEKINVG